MKLRRLSITRMPGFEQHGFSLDELDGGVNVVVGPNASGKTTTCRAIRALLWPQSLGRVQPIALDSLWDDDSLRDDDSLWNDGDGALTRIHREGSRVEYQRDGLPVDPPPLPPPHLAGCFTITVDDLFAGTDTDRGLAEQLAREMAGGYDLSALRELDLLKASSRTAGKLDNAARKARQQRRRLQDEQQQLRGEQERLAGLRRERDRASAARSELARLEDARTLCDLRAELAGVEAELAAFPPGMDRLRGDELRRLEQLDADRTEQRQALDRSRHEAEQARARLEETALPQGGVPRRHLAEQQTRLTRLRELAQELRQAQSRSDEARSRQDEARRVIGDAATPEGLDALDAAAMNRLEQYHRDAAQLATRHQTARARLELLDGESPPADRDPIVRGLDLLRQWLETAPGSSGDRRPRAALAWALIGLLGVLAVVLAVGLHWAWSALLLVAVAAGFLAATIDRQSRLQAETIRRQYARLELPDPPAWRTDDVGRHVTQVERWLVDAVAAERREDEARQLRQQLEQLDQQRRQLAVERAQLVDRFGFAPDASDLALVVLAGALKAFHDARAARATASARVEQLRAEHDAELAAVNRWLGDFGLEPADRHDLADQRARDLARRADEYREADDQQRRAAEKAEQATAAIERLDRQTEQLFREAGCLGETSTTNENDDASRRRAIAGADAAGEPASTPHRSIPRDGAHGLGEVLEGTRPESTLADRLDRLDDYRVAVRQRDKLLAQREGLDDRLAGHEELKTLDRDQIDERTEAARQSSDRYEELLGRIKDIEHRVDDAGRRTAIEEALADEREAIAELDEWREHTERAAAARLLLEQIQAEHQSESRPPVLRRADRWFSQFTRGRYRLRLAGPDGGEDQFRAEETDTHRGLALGELSRGTRMQLLLAVRLAFAAGAERGSPLPLLLDEVLSSTDPERFAAVADCLLTLTDEGRQVFYFTCQPGDAAAWASIARSRGQDGCHTIDLAAVRRLEYEPGPLLSVATLDRPEIPPPEDRSMAEYAERIGVPALDPTAGAAPAHLAHLLDDPATLHRLLSTGIERWGQLDALHRAGAVDGSTTAGRQQCLIDPDRLRRAAARARLLDAFAQAWRIGRGRPVTREVLEAAGVSEKFIDGIAELAAEGGGSARAVIEAIEARDDDRVKGFHRSVLATMTDRLTESGHLDPRPTLDRDQLRAEVLAAVADDLQAEAITPAEVEATLRHLWDRASA